MPGFLGGSSGGGSTVGGEISFAKEFIDPVTKLRVSQPENLIDTDFEYGLQPTKWETLELINNTPSFFSKSGDTTIPGIVAITTNAGTREITVTTSLDHGLAVGIPIQVTGTKSITADGSFIINSIPNATTFTYLCKDDQDNTASIEDLYSSIITGEFFQGSEIRVQDSAGITTDGESLSTLTVTTGSTHGFGTNTPFYFLNINSTISQEFQSSNTSSKSFDSSNSATAQTFDGSNSLSTINIDWSNAPIVGGVVSTISSVSTTNGTITVSHGTENFSGKTIGTPLYYDVVSGGGYFNANPRGVVFLNSTDSLGTSSSTFSVSETPNGASIVIESSLAGTFQLANQARTFAGNNINPVTEVSLDIVREAAIGFEGANDGALAASATQLTVATVSSYSAGLITITVSDTSKELAFYNGAMVLYSTTGSAATGLSNNTTYFVDDFFGTSPAGTYRMTLKPLPTSATITSITGGTGVQTFTRIGVSADKDVVHVRDSNYAVRDMLEYEYPAGGSFVSSSAKNYYIIETKYDAHNYTLRDAPVPDGLSAVSAGTSAAQLKADWGYNTDGLYWIDLPTAGPTQVHCIMSSTVDGGGWMQVMRATRGATFNFDSSYWTAANTLNAGTPTNQDQDAKFNTYNYFAAKDIMAVFPDVQNGGTLGNLGRGWIWHENNFYGGTRVTPLSWFGSVAGTNRYIRAPRGWSGQVGGPFTTQVGYQWYGWNASFGAYGPGGAPGTARGRWSMVWNNETTEGSTDVWGGIGFNAVYNYYSAGDYINCCPDWTGVNRSMRFEMYVR